MAAEPPEHYRFHVTCRAQGVNVGCPQNNERMARLVKIRTLNVIVAAIVLALSSLAVSSLAHARETLVIGISQFPSTFHPSINSMLAKSYILAMTRRPITTYDKDWKLVCMLCTKLPTIENGLAKREKTPDNRNGVAMTFTLQPDAKWGDGVPVSTKDVIFTWEAGKNDRSGIGGAELYRRIYKIDVIDEKTFTLHVDRLTFDYNSMSGFDLLPEHIERKRFSNPAEYRHKTAYDTDTLDEGLYSGPYVISAVSPGSHVTLERNPNWWGKRPVFKKIIVRIIENTAALEANILSGEIDMIAGELGLTIDQALSFEKRNGNDFRIIYKPGLIYEHIDLNLDNPILRDLKVRQAMIHAIDRQAISQQLFGGKQPVAISNVNPLDAMYAMDLPSPSYDRKKAARLLADAGWATMKNGVRINNKGESLTLDFITTAGNRTRELVQQVLQSQWRKLGIDVRIKNQPARVFFGESLTERTYTGLGMYAWISSPESVPRSTLHSAYIPDKNNGYSGQNYPGFKNPEIDDLLDRIEVELDPEKRRPLWRRLQEIYIQEIPVIPLYFRANSHILPKWLKGVEPTGHQYPSTLWVENWSVEN